MISLIFHFTEEDKPYLHMLKPLLAGRAISYLDNSIPVSAYEFVAKSKAKNNAVVVTTSEVLLKLLHKDAVRTPKVDAYAGSIFCIADAQFLIVPPLKQLATVTYGKFVMERYLSKFLAPKKFLPIIPFRWELFSPSNIIGLVSFFQETNLIAVDIETVRDDPEKRISCISFTGLRFPGPPIHGYQREIGTSTVEARTVVVPFDSTYNVAFVRTLLKLPNAKVFQNGKYDIAYLFRFNCIPNNYAFDTINLFHSWLAELPKDLGFISSFMLRSYRYHKNDGQSGDIYDYYGYNAMDTHTTALTCLALLMEMPDYAIENYLMEFPVVFPCILSEHTGLRWNSATGDKLKKQVEKQIEQDLSSLQRMVASPSFNPGSPQQTVRLFAVLGSKDVTSSNPAGKDKVASRHPLNKRIMERITSYRESSKLNSSYFKDGVVWNGRVFYALNPHGTDTGRLASRESQFWVGFQIQNIPVDVESGPSVKEAFESDEGFLFGECDYSQAEARGTGYISGDVNLITAVDDVSRDFHGHNASAFFGLPYEQIVQSTEKVQEDGTSDWVHKVVNKPLRNLSKRTNHGANYRMGAQVMLDTMGIEKVLEAKRLLGLPARYYPLDVTAHLLKVWAATYPVVDKDWVNWMKDQVTTTGFLVGPIGWTRRCFGDPKKSKPSLNAYVAHQPQSLNAMLLNKAYVRVFNEVYLTAPQDFKLCAQIHDSILFQYRRGREDLAHKVKECMILPTKVKDIFGVTRTLTVPVDLKGNGTTWANVKPL